MQKTYRVATSDYIANGGDRCDFLIGLKQNNAGLLLRDALLQYLKNKKSIQPNTQNRFTFQTKP
jgi:2',3'-cyclic-nucleotide 2'-phosphodiesterase (5'-nucleotidase family)